MQKVIFFICINFSSAMCAWKIFNSCFRPRSSRFEVGNIYLDKENLSNNDYYCKRENEKFYLLFHRSRNAYLEFKGTVNDNDVSIVDSLTYSSKKDNLEERTVLKRESNTVHINHIENVEDDYIAKSFIKKLVKYAYLSGMKLEGNSNNSKKFVEDVLDQLKFDRSGKKKFEQCFSSKDSFFKIRGTLSNERQYKCENNLDHVERVCRLPLRGAFQGYIKPNNLRHKLNDREEFIVSFEGDVSRESFPKVLEVVYIKGSKEFVIGSLSSENNVKPGMLIVYKGDNSSNKFSKPLRIGVFSSRYDEQSFIDDLKDSKDLCFFLKDFIELCRKHGQEVEISKRIMSILSDNVHYV